jgi:hypothetical protein
MSIHRFMEMKDKDSVHRRQVTLEMLKRVRYSLNLASKRVINEGGTKVRRS